MSGGYTPCDSIPDTKYRRVYVRQSRRTGQWKFCIGLRLGKSGEGEIVGPNSVRVESELNWSRIEQRGEGVNGNRGSQIKVV